MSAIDAAVAGFIDVQRVARLATVDGDGRPHIVPICFARDDDRLYTPIDEKPKSGDYARLRRLRNIAVHPRVQVLFDRYDDGDWSRLAYVQLRGPARVLDGGEERERALAMLRERYAQYRAMSLEARPVIAIEVDAVVAWGEIGGRADGG